MGCWLEIDGQILRQNAKGEDDRWVGIVPSISLNDIFIAIENGQHDLHRIQMVMFQFANC